MSATQHWDILFKNALIIDGTGNRPETGDIAVKDGKIAERAPELDATRATKVVDCEDKWLLPGMLDIHTHFDLEVEIAPGLPEAVRHGSTTVVVSNCSLGVAYGNQRKGNDDPIVDCFARVENMPKHVLEKVAKQCDWNDSGVYLDHFENINLGPNIVPMIPHSMLRIEVMGLQDSITRKPTKAELDEMCRLTEKGMREGYVGFSTDSLPFHYLANDPHRQEKIPTQFASFKELKKLTGIVRRYGRVWQATPEKDNRLKIFRNFLLTSGRLYGRTLKVTAVAAIDLVMNKGIGKMGLLLTKILNSKLVKGHFRFQALSAPFKVWADGAITPLSEEVPELRELNIPDLEDSETRRNILNDADYIRRFRKMWFHDKRGFNIARIKRWLRISDNVLSRELQDMHFDLTPVEIWNGECMQDVYQRLLRWQDGDQAAASNEAEAEAFAKFDNPIHDDANFFLHLLREYDTDLRWHTTTANRDPEMLKKLLFHPQILPGFNDSGAHLTNMAFYDGNLRTLKLAQAEGMGCVAEQIKRLTREPAEFFGVDAGSLEIGAQADIAVIDPAALKAYVPEDCIEYIYRDEFNHEQMVNRVPGVVQYVAIAGKLAWYNGDFTAALGKERFGRALRDKSYENGEAEPATLPRAA